MESENGIIRDWPFAEMVRNGPRTFLLHAMLKGRKQTIVKKAMAWDADHRGLTVRQHSPLRHATTHHQEPSALGMLALMHRSTRRGSRDANNSKM